MEEKCYVDLYQTCSFASLVRQLANAVLGTLDTREAKVLKTVAAFRIDSARLFTT